MASNIIAFFDGKFREIFTPSKVDWAPKMEYAPSFLNRPYKSFKKQYQNILEKMTGLLCPKQNQTKHFLHHWRKFIQIWYQNDAVAKMQKCLVGFTCIFDWKNRSILFYSVNIRQNTIHILCLLKRWDMNKRDLH